MEQLNFIQKPLVSIVITYYNMGKYINDCINSILKQTYDKYEIIIVNDGSDKENSKILNDINCAKIINLKENKGQLCALYEGLNEAKGEFICMVDADDILLPNYLKTLLFSHLNNNFALISSSKGIVNENGELISLNSSKDKIDYGEIDKLFITKESFEVKKVKAPFGLWSWNPSTSAMWRKSALDILKYYPDKEYWKCGADKVIFSLLHLIGSSANIDAVLFLYRVHSSNNFNSSNLSGDKKYLCEKTIVRLINWNVKLRLDTLKMFFMYKDKLIEQYNKLNYYKMFFRIVFCINFTVFVKILKAIIHKIAF